jgi:NAD(P)-dependent dehydrogenase (short-subunit alcohol dehydrogenase family)
MKTTIVTGGSKGIGYGIAESLIKEGWHVAITGRTQRSLDDAILRLSQIRKDHAMGIVADVRNYVQQQAVVDKVVNTWGQLDALIANAGIGHFGSIETLTHEQWHETLDTNLTGVFYGIQAAIPALKKSKGYIITIASLAGTNFFAGGSAYNASKFGLVGFTQAVMMDLRRYDIKVSTIMPGSVATHFNGHTPVAEDAWKIQPEDIGELVVDVLKMNPRTLPSKIEVRPSRPPEK